MSQEEAEGLLKEAMNSEASGDLELSFILYQQSLEM